MSALDDPETLDVIDEECHQTGLTRDQFLLVKIFDELVAIRALLQSQQEGK